MTVEAQLDELYAVGDGEGADRPGLSEAEDAAHRLVERWMREAGLETARDRAGNLYGRLVGAEPALPEVWSGSHLDSVPRGGRLDGALGVVAAVAALRRIAGLPVRPRRTLTAVAFRDEEGWRFGRGMFGSRALTGALAPGTLDAHDADGTTVREALAGLGFALDGAAGWLADPPATFVEVHIEQGPVLADLGAPLGIVESIAGLVELEVAFHGQEGHAGTVPMRLRRDAGLAAAAFQVALATAALDVDGGVATVGRMTLHPGASNVIPGTARLVVDARAPDDARRDRLGEIVRREAVRAAERHGCRVDVAVTARTGAAIADDRTAPRSPPRRRTRRHLASGAGHDAQVLAAAGVPIGMLFVRSLAGGVSHSPAEHSDPADVERAVDALTLTLRELAGDA